MVYYPVLSAPYCLGQSTLYNFKPNNWEPVKQSQKHIILSQIDDGQWKNQLIDTLEVGQIKAISSNQFGMDLTQKGISLLSLSSQVPERITPELPPVVFDSTIVPAHRATLALVSEHSMTSYQGEISPFPATGSCLSFSPFLQFGRGIENYVLLMNVEKQAVHRDVKIEIYDMQTKQLRSVQEASSNCINVISLDSLGFSTDSLPVVVCRSMAFIPLYFSTANQGEYLSLEHTHPPASMVIHGNRIAVQKVLKQHWFAQLQYD